MNISELQINKKKTLTDLYKMVTNEEITPLINEDGEIVGFNFHKNVTGVKFSKIIQGHITVGSTEEEREQDEKNLREFIKAFSDYTSLTIKRTIELSYRLKAKGIVPTFIELVPDEGLVYGVYEDLTIYDEDGEIFKTFEYLKDTPLDTVELVMRDYLNER